MADIEIQMTGSGAVGDVSNWTVNEFSTPTNASASPSGVGNADIDAKSKSDSKFIVDNATVISNPGLGSFVGIVDEVQPYNIDTSFNVISNLSLLNADVVAQATGQQALSDIFSYYVSLATSEVPVAYEASSDPLRVYGGWSGNLWSALNVLSAVNRVELAAVGGSLVIRDLGAVTTSVDDLSAIELTLSTDATGVSIDIVNQNTELVSTIGGTKFNLSANPSLESNATDWSSTVFNCTVSAGRAAQSPTVGTYSYRSEVLSVGSGIRSHTTTHEVDITSVADSSSFGVSIGVKATIYRTYGVAAVGSFPLEVRIGQDGDGSIAGYWATTIPRYSLSAGTDGYETFSYTVTFPSQLKVPGSTTLYINVTSNTMGGAFSFTAPIVGDRINSDAALITPGALVPYFDGNSPGAVWAGTTNNSISSMTVTDGGVFYDARVADQIFSVNAGETVQNVITTTNFPDFLAQPIHQFTTPAVAGAYYVSDSANAGVSTSNWSLYGGLVTVAIGNSPGEIVLTLQGPTTDIPGSPGPYYLGYYDGFDRIPALSVVGTGVTTEPTVVRVVTGADPAKTSREVSAQLDSQFITDLPTLFDIAPWISVENSGPVMVLTATIGTHQIEGFGLTQGSLITYDDCIYRVIESQVGPTSTRLTARWYTTIEAAQAQWADSGAVEFDSFWEGFDAQDYQIAPLRSYASSGLKWLFPATDLYPRSVGLYPGVQLTYTV